MTGAEFEQGKGRAVVAEGLIGMVSRPTISLCCRWRAPPTASQFGKAHPPAGPHLDEAYGLALPLCHLVQVAQYS
jgi:hypothetical protein